MCGIVGCWLSCHNNVGDITLSIKRATDAMAHRGPDDNGVWVDKGNGIFFGHRRLSIIDLSDSGHQPMVSEKNKLCVVFNGEIYNYIELKQLLQSKGYAFKSNSDTEVLLNAYLYYEEDFVKQLRGMFAFSLWDGRKKQLILARDRAGKKPLYYARNSSGIYFASEINALKILLPADALELDMESLNSYLSWGGVSGDRTIYSGMKEIPPGTLLICNSYDQVIYKKYWYVNWGADNKIGADEAIERVEVILKESIKLRLRSDVPVGIFLSGGIDSGLITAIAAEMSENAINTFCVGFDDSNFDERPLARIVAKNYGTRHTDIVLRPDIASSLPKIAKTYGEPFADPSAIPSYFISQFVAQHTKVVLNGDGGDELFCGYRRHVAAKLLTYFHSNRFSYIYKWTIPCMLRNIPVPKNNRNGFAFAYRFMRALNTDGEDRLLILSSDGIDNEQKKKLFKDPSVMKFSNKSMIANCDGGKRINGLESMIRLDFESSLPEILLKKMDIASMAHGLEARSPFLDQEMVSLAFSLPFSVRLPGITTKPLLRKLAKKYLPEDVTSAPKRGFEIPTMRWLKGELRQLRDDIVLANSGLLADLFNRTYLENLLRGPLSDQLAPGRWANIVWMLLMLGLWDQTCWNKNS